MRYYKKSTKVYKKYKIYAIGKYNCSLNNFLSVIVLFICSYG